MNVTTTVTTVLPLLLQAATTDAPAAAAPGPNRMFVTLAMYAVIFAIFYFILIRPQQRQRKALEDTVSNLKKGDEVVTAGGIVGEVVNIRQLNAGAPSQDDRITIKSGESRLIVERGRIAKVGVVKAVPGTAASGTSAS